MKPRAGKVRDTWTTAITKDACDDGRFVSVLINRVDKRKFQIGDLVRVTVTLLKRWPVARRKERSRG